MTPEEPEVETLSVDAPTQETPTTRRRGRGRRTPEGPRATFRQLLPFIFEHKRTLVVVAVLAALLASLLPVIRLARMQPANLVKVFTVER